MINASVRLVHDRKNETKGDKTLPALLQIEVRLLKSTKRTYLSTNYKIAENQFTYKNGIFNCFNHPIGKVITVRVNVMLRTIYEFINSERCNSLEDVRNWDKEDEDSGEVIPFIKRELRGRNLAYGTIEQHNSTIRILEKFGDIQQFKDCTYNNISSFDKYLRRKGQVEATAYKKHSILRSYLKEAVKQGLLKDNPYDVFEVKKGRSKDPIYLTEEELDRIKKWSPINEKLAHVQDMFLFQCYTGMAYSDMAKFDKSEINKEGEYDVIRSNRQKTKERFVNILLPEAKEILEKYEYQLPIITNQKYNDYLKVIMAHIGISKNVTSHVARHSYAVFLLNKGVPIEVVSVALGHSNIKMTQHYAKLLSKTTIEELGKRLINKK